MEWEGELLNRLFENATPMAQAGFLAEKGYGRPKIDPLTGSALDRGARRPGRAPFHAAGSGVAS
ncbi:hypothetical protein [Streptomyces gobitricini]|uniref:hypothetical protein n=1 Tax=Streptomyces gobitricini TaxID=68211 RepID=UPI0031D6652A